MYMGRGGGGGNGHFTTVLNTPVLSGKMFNGIMCRQSLKNQVAYVCFKQYPPALLTLSPTL